MTISPSMTLGALSKLSARLRRRGWIGASQIDSASTILILEDSLIAVKLELVEPRSFSHQVLGSTNRRTIWHQGRWVPGFSEAWNRPPYSALRGLEELRVVIAYSADCDGGSG